MTPPTVLVIDDEPFNLDYLQQELEDAGLAVLLAPDGERGLDMVRSEHPDLILLDIMMPRMDGFEVLRRLKADADTRDVPVVVISADSGLSSVVQGIRLGAEDYLSKPIEPVLLHARIQSGLERKRLHDLEVLQRRGLEREMEIARQIQHSFLPEQLPALDSYDLAARFRSAREVAGDFYDAFVLPNGRLACVLGDVCGKGIGAALYMTLFRSLTRATLSSNCFQGDAVTPLSPREALVRAMSFINRYVGDVHGSEGTFCALFVALLDPRSGTLTYSNCGSEPPLVVSQGRVRARLGPTGPVVGILEDAAFEVEAISLEPGETLLAYTDGVTDALNEAGDPFDLAGVRAALIDGGATLVVDHLELRVVEHIGSATPFDDITLIALGRQAAPEKTR